VTEDQPSKKKRKTHKRNSATKPAEVNWRVWYLGAVLFFVSIPLALFLWNPFTGVQQVRRRVALVEGRAELEVVAPALLQAIFGSDLGFWSRVAGGTQVMRLNLDQSKVNDADLSILRKTPFLKGLHLANTQITDLGLSDLRYARRLEELVLQNTVVTDDGLLDLPKLKHLHSLNLDGTQVTEGVGELLKQMPNLKTVSLVGTSIAPAALDKLQSELNNVKLVSKLRGEASGGPVGTSTPVQTPPM
jgi:hypothetical protein